MILLFMHELSLFSFLINIYGSFFRYASESAEDACKWAYKDVSEGSVLDGKQWEFWWLWKIFSNYLFCSNYNMKMHSADEYFFSRFPIVNLRLAQGGVRLAATLNRIFKGKYAAMI